jgi:hypothetical protein
MLDQNVRAHQSEAGFVGIQFYAEQSVTGAVFQTDTDI